MSTFRKFALTNRRTLLTTLLGHALHEVTQKVALICRQTFSERLPPIVCQKRKLCPELFVPLLLLYDLNEKTLKWNLWHWQNRTPNRCLRPRRFLSPLLCANDTASSTERMWNVYTLWSSRTSQRTWLHPRFSSLLASLSSWTCSWAPKCSMSAATRYLYWLRKMFVCFFKLYLLTLIFFYWEMLLELWCRLSGALFSSVFGLAVSCEGFFSVAGNFSVPPVGLLSTFGDVGGLVSTTGFLSSILGYFRFEIDSNKMYPNTRLPF